MRTSKFWSILLLLLCLVFSSNSTNAQIFEWASSAGDGERDRGQDIVVDSEGNVYTTGFFGGTADFDPGPGSEVLTAFDERDAFVAKYDSDGNLIWAHQFGHYGEDEGTGITLDQDENPVITGWFSGLTDFDTGPEEYILHGFSNDIFVLKLDPEGNLIWVAQMGGDLNQRANDVAIDSQGNIYSVGMFFGTCDFDPGEGEESISALNAADGFICKLDSEGNFEWARMIRGENFVQPVSIDIDSNDNAYVAGKYQGDIEFGLEENPFTLSPNAFSSSFYCKLNSAGDFIWAKGHTEAVTVTRIVVDPEGDLITSGMFNEPTDFDLNEGEFEMTQFDPVNSLGSTSYVSKMSSDGSFIWAKKIGGLDFDFNHSAAIDSQGNIIIAGGFNEYTDFDPGPDTVLVEAVGAAATDIFVCKLNSDGEYKWVKTLGNEDYQRAWDITIDDEGNIYTTGAFRSDLNFATFDGEHILSSNGFYDYYVTKWSACTNTYSFDEHTACGSFTWMDGNTYTESNYTATVVMQNVTCCDSIITLNLTIPEIETDVVVTDESMYSYQSQAIYQWFECVDDELIPMEGETDQTLYPDTIGYYAVSVENEGCVDTSGCNYFGTVGLEEKLSEVAFSIFPNPTRGKLTIEGNSKALEVRLTDLQGQLVKRDTTNHLDVSSLAPGVYLISIKSENGIWRKRVVKK